MDNLSFDVRTLNLVIALECIALGLFVSILKIAASSHRGILRWSLALLSLGAGFLIYALGLWDRPITVGVIANSLFMLSTAFQLDGIWVSKGKNPKRGLLFYVPVPVIILVSAITTISSPNIPLRVGLLAGSIGVYYLMAAWIHLRDQRKRENWVNRWLALVFFVNGFFNVFRIFGPRPGAEAPFAQEHASLPGAALLLVGISALAWSLGYMLLIALSLSGEMAEAKLARAREERDIFLRHLVDNIPFSIYYKNSEGEITLNNHFFRESLGLDESSIGGKREEDLFPEAIAARHEEFDREALKRDCPYESIIEMADGDDVRWIDSTHIPVTDIDGRPNGILVLEKDISEPIKSRRALEESEKRLRELSDTLERRVAERTEELTQARRYVDVFFEVTLDFLCVTGSEGSILKLNPSWYRAFGWREDEVLGTCLLEHLHEDDRSRIEPQTRLLLDNQRIDNVEARIMRADGSWAWLSWSACFVPEMHVIILSAHDVSARVETEEQLKRARREAERASWAKTQLIDTISHELRTPLNAVLGYASLLDSFIDEDRGKHYLSSLSSAGKSLLAIINDILDLSRAETGRLELRMVPFDPRRLLHEIHDIFYFSAEEKSLRFSLHGREALPQMILLDVDRLRQVLINLTGNAIKFTDMGAVAIIMDARKETGSEDPEGRGTWKVRLIIDVEDSGIGISEDYHRHLFEPFTQQDATISRNYGGTGLGLSIAKRLVDLMGGSISCESPLDRKENRGTRFHIEIPSVSASGSYAGARETADALSKTSHYGENGIESLLDTKNGSPVPSLLQSRQAILLAHSDELTGLNTRRSILTRMYLELNRMQREGDCLGIIICDIDRLKHINDNYGHAAGDSILQSVALFLSSVCSKDDILGRWGGDEFIAMIPRCSWERLSELSNRLVEEIHNKKFYSEGQTLQTAISVGASIVRPAEGSPAYICSNALVRSAEDAVHRAKARGRNCWEYIEVNHQCARRELPNERSLFQ